MTQRPKYSHSMPSLSPAAPMIIQKAVWKGQVAERMLKKPRETEQENIDICTNHCQCPGKPCSGSPRRMEKCRMKYEMENGK